MSQYAIGDILAGKYQIKAILGAGGMGTVYRARQKDLGRDVAIKVPNPAALQVPGFLARFEREAKTVARLVHDNIVQVYEYHHEGDFIYIVMEYVEGQDLKSLVTHPSPGLKVKDIATILKASCEGLGFAHENGIVHRDIKPHNIMVQQMARGRWRVKIMDFGIAHLEQSAGLTQQGEQLTMTGQAIGTPSYMSPEQVRGKGICAQSDIYSFGCVIFYVFTRTTPFTGTGFTVAAAHISDPPPPLRTKVPDLPEPLEVVINRCLEKDPGARPQHATDLGEELFESLRPQLDKRMDTIWPEAPALADSAPIPPTRAAEVDMVTEASAPLGGEHANDATIASNDGHTATVPSATEVPSETKSVGKGAFEPTAHTAPVSGSGTFQPIAEHLSAATMQMPTQGSVAAPGIGQKKGLNKLLIAGIVIAPILLGAAVMAVMVNQGMLFGKRGNNGGGNGGEVVNNGGISTGGNNSAVGPTMSPVPTATPKPRPTGTPTATPTPSPVPTPSPDPVKEEVRTLTSRLENQNSIAGKVQVWRSATNSALASAQPVKQLADDIARSLALDPEMVNVHGETFSMGNVDSSGSYPEEQPVHNVTLSSYAIGKYEVTAIEYATFLNSIPAAQAEAYFDSAPKRDSITYSWNESKGRYFPKETMELHPANGVSWEAAKAYTDWLSRETNKSWRLPTEAQWEFAARGNTQHRFPWGTDSPDSSKARFDSEHLNPPTQAVTSNPAGASFSTSLNMAGNVAEWCEDWYHDDAYQMSLGRDPVVSEEPRGARPKRVLRGGSFLERADDLRASRRLRQEPDDPHVGVGFRLVLENI